MNRLILLFVFILLEGGCAIPVRGNHNINISVPQYATLPLAALRVAVKDVSEPRTTRELALGLGFERLPDTLYKPTPAEMLKFKIESVLQASGGTSSIDVIILDSGFYVKRQIEDKLPIASIFASGQTMRPYMCTAKVTVLNGSRSEQKSLSFTTESLDPMDELAFRISIHRCQFELVRLISEAAKELL